MTNIVKQKYMAELNGEIAQHQDVSTRNENSRNVLKMIINPPPPAVKSLLSRAFL